MLIQARAATAIAARIAALPVPVRRNTRSGICRLRAHGVRPRERTSRAGEGSSVTPGPVQPPPTQPQHSHQLPRLAPGLRPVRPPWFHR